MNIKFTKTERILLLALLQTQKAARQILAALGKPTGDFPDTDDAAEILSMGAEHFYSDALGCLGIRLSDEREITTEESGAILDVLDMYRAIDTYKREHPADKEVSEHPAARFRGFDGNHESRQRWFVHFAVFRMGLYSELKPKGKESPDFNSHRRMTPKYKQMVEAWRKSANPANLKQEEVLAVLKAADEKAA